MKWLFIILLFSCNPIKEQAEIIGFRNGKSVLVIDERNGIDTILWGQRRPSKVGERYWIFWGCKNKIIKIMKIKTD